MSTPNDKEIDYMVGDQIVRARSYEAACKQALAEEKANQEKIGATVQAARASATQPQQFGTKDGRTTLILGDHRSTEEKLRCAQVQIQCDRETIDALQAQRDELLGFVRKVNAHLSKHSGTVDVKTACKWSDESDAAIARATEGGKASES